MVLNDQPAVFQQKGALYAFQIAFVAAVGGFLFGYDLALISGANLYIRDQFGLSPFLFGLVTASATLGCIFGPFLGAWLSDGIGRKKTLIIASILLAIGAIATAIAPDVYTIIVFRIVGGLGVGLCSIASPMYITEVAPPQKRGKLGVIYQLLIVIGSVMAAAAAFFLAKYLPATTCWRWMFFSQMAAVLPFIVLLFFLPESPRWLAEKNRFQDALQVITFVQGPERAETEIKEIKDSLSQEEGTFAELFKPGFRMALLIGSLLAIFNNWSGWSGAGGYLVYLLEKSGLPSRTGAILQLLIAYGVMGVFTMTSCFLVDRFGRKPLWNLSSILMAVFMLIVGLVFHYNITGPIVLIVVCLFAIPHALALGPLPWLMMSELYPTRLRAKAVAITTTVIWVAGFTGALVLPVIAEYSEKLIGSVGGLFWLYTIICIFALIFGIKLLPETKGKTLEQIAEQWRKH